MNLSILLKMPMDPFRPYFTNGSAKSVGDVLDRVQVRADGGFVHDGNLQRGRSLDAREKRELEAFLDLL